MDTVEKGFQKEINGHWPESAFSICKFNPKPNLEKECHVVEFREQFRSDVMPEEEEVVGFKMRDVKGGGRGVPLGK